MHAEYMPIEIKSFVDDCPQLHTGKAQFLVQHVPKAAVAFAQKLRARNLKISPKTTLVCSSMQLGRNIQQLMAEQDVHISLDSSGRDVGADFSGGSRRRVSIQDYRIAKVQSSVNAISMLGKYTKQAAKLAFTNAKPKLYAMSAMGLSPTKRAKCRSLLCRPLGVRKTGGCLTMAMATHRLHYKDPALTLAIDNILDCVIAIAQSPLKLTAIAWNRTMDNLSTNHRWAHVKGPLSSMMATLIDFNWAPEEYDKWYDPSGKVWNIDYSAPNLASMVREVLTHFSLLRNYGMTRTNFILCAMVPLTSLTPGKP